jgi:hypothetical protein
MSISIDEDLSSKDAADARCEMGHSPVGNTSGDMYVCRDVPGDVLEVGRFQFLCHVRTRGEAVRMDG